MDVGIEQLLAGYPGRILAMESFTWLPEDTGPEELYGLIVDAVASVPYSDGVERVRGFDFGTEGFAAHCARLLDRLSHPWLTAFTSPQRHHGHLREFRPIRVENPHDTSSLPHKAFWTATPLPDDPGEDTWSVSGEMLRADPVHELSFEPAELEIYAVTGLDSWLRLLENHPRRVDGILLPDWPAIAEHFDAVHLTPLGLLLAHPPESLHTQGVAHWSAASTCWFRLPSSLVRNTD